MALTALETVIIQVDEHGELSETSICEAVRLGHTRCRRVSFLTTSRVS